MDQSDHVCLCFHVSQRKICSFLKRTEPRVASQLSDCLGAGTGCGWCVPFLEQLHRQWSQGQPPQLKVDPVSYANRREAYRASRSSDKADPDT